MAERRKEYEADPAVCIQFPWMVRDDIPTWDVYPCFLVTLVDAYITGGGLFETPIATVNIPPQSYPLFRIEIPDMDSPTRNEELVKAMRRAIKWLNANHGQNVPFEEDYARELASDIKSVGPMLRSNYYRYQLDASYSVQKEHDDAQKLLPRYQRAKRNVKARLDRYSQKQKLVYLNPLWD